MFVCIIILFVFGCMNIKTHKGNKHIENYFTKQTDERYKIGIDNFVFMVKKHQLEIGCGEHSMDPICDPIILSTASGLVFTSDDKSIFVLTAAHFCQKENYPGINETISGVTKDQERPLMIVAMDEVSDICLLIGIKYKNETFNQIELELKEPPLGSDVYTVAAPNGIGGPGIRPVFEGKFAGCSELNCMSTIPATFGSSGAGIYTKEGKLITIVMAVTKDFNDLVLSPSQSEMYKFIRTFDNSVDIYEY